MKDDQIAELNRRLEQAQKLVDQSRQLELKTQLQLEAEQQKVLAFETDQPVVKEKKILGSIIWLVV